MPKKLVAGATKRTDDRKCNWTFILYPESAPVNWISILNGMHLQFIVSPLHDKDIEEGTTDKLKKAHYHVLLKFPTKKSFEQIREIVTKLNCPPIPEAVDNFQSMVRYLCHLDDPDKYQYSTSEIQSFGGLDAEEYLAPLSTMRRMYIRQMIDFIEENDIIEFRDLLWYARRYRNDDWFNLITDNCTFLMNTYIKSRRNGKNNKVVVLSPEGEYIGEV